jgi:DNA-binding MarR family transcriptional regulator
MNLGQSSTSFRFLLTTPMAHAKIKRRIELENSPLPQPSTRAVDRALAILLCFKPDESTLTLTQIVERVGMHKSTVHRLLATLERKRFLQRQPNIRLRQWQL